MPALAVHSGPVHQVLPDGQDCYLDRFYGRERMALVQRVVDLSGEPLDVIRSVGCDESGWWVVRYEGDEIGRRRMDPATGKPMVRTLTGEW